MLSDRLADVSAADAFAAISQPTKQPPLRPMSFFDFAALLRKGAPRTATVLEPAWQMGYESAQLSEPDMHSEIPRLLEHAKMCCSAPAAPIVAVLGLLNAGKSSLVSTYLSDDNRDRILVGSSNSQGTHRFVLWLPESWREESTVWDFVQSRLKAIFGCESEPLSLDPHRANSQYNDTTPRSYTDAAGLTQYRETIEIPLVATDRELDRWGLALMDCPDVQTGFLPTSALSLPHVANARQEQFHEQSQSIADARLNVLAIASPLCSAFIVVLPANAMHDQTVSRLLRVLQDRMPGVQQILAVNRVPRRYATSEIHAELANLYGQHSIRRQYMAYGFDGPQQRERLPAYPSGMRAGEEQPLPLFFRIDEKPIPQPPNPVSDRHWLMSIGSQLDKQSLFRDSLASTLSKLQALIGNTVHQCRLHAQESIEIAAALRRSVANACLDFSLDGTSSKPTKVRLQASRQIVQQISKSLERTAPWWAMPGRWTARMAEASKASISSATDWLHIPRWFTGRTEAIGGWIRSRLSSGKEGKIVTADSLVESLRQHDKRGYLKLDDGLSDAASAEETRMELRRACQRAIDRFQKESLIQLDDGELDRFTAKMWESMPLSKRLLTGLAPAGILFAPLIAVIMVPLDFGGSAVLVFASMKELLFAGAAGVGLVMASADSMPQIAESETAWQQLGDLYAVLCDEMGLERPMPGQVPSVAIGGKTRELAISRIAISTSGSDAIGGCVPPTYIIHARSLSEIESTVRKLVELHGNW